jgi:hypothetical protein
MSVELEDYQKAVGKIISDAYLADDYVTVKFTDGSRLDIYDGGQSCCEHRYITSDDDLYSAIGEEFVGISEGHYESGGSEDYCHDMMFVYLQTNRDSYSFCTHNEHNGYYGGFSVNCSYTEKLEDYQENKNDY